MSQIFSPKSIENSFKATLDQDESTRRRCQQYGAEDDEMLTDEQRDDSSDNETIAQVMKHSQWKVQLNANSKRIDYKQICSICLRDGGTVSHSIEDQTLITPCLCSGIRSHQHKRCIEEWIELTGASSCPFCLVRYDFTRKKKSFWTYIKDCELQGDFLVSIAAFLFSFYLFLIGLAVCYSYMFAVYKCDHVSINNQLLLEEPMLESASSWVDLERLVDCYRFAKQLDDSHSWSSIALFCVVCTSTVLLFIGIFSLGLNMIFRHYIKYLIWSKTNFRVSVRSYQIGTAPAATDS